MLSEMIYRMKNYLARRRIMKIISASKGPSTERADAIYELLRLTLEPIDRRRGISFNEYRIVSGVMLATVFKLCPTRKDRLICFKQIKQLASQVSAADKEAA